VDSTGEAGRSRREGAFGCADFLLPESVTGLR